MKFLIPTLMKNTTLKNLDLGGQHERNARKCFLINQSLLNHFPNKQATVLVMVVSSYCVKHWNQALEASEDFTEDNLRVNTTFLHSQMF